MAQQRFVSHKSRHSSIKLLLSIGAFVFIFSLFMQGVTSLSDHTRTRQKESLKAAISRDITNCYAMEGFYPEDLAYLKEHYGLTYNEDLFFVDYQVTGSNIRPEVTIIERKGHEPYEDTIK